MRRLLPLLACLMLVLTLWAGTGAHATESMLPIDSIAAAHGEHSAGDADEVPADSDRATPHHHGVCHGHDLSVVQLMQTRARATAPAIRCAVPVAALHSTGTDPALRPPQA